MSWATVANNQTVSFSNLADAVANGVFTQKTGIPDSNEQITKANADTYVNINTAYAPYAAKASNQLVVKSDLDPVITSFAHTIYYYTTCYWDGIYLEAGASTASTACTSNAYSITLYSSDFALGNGSLLYTDSGLSNPWYSDTLCEGGAGYFLVGEYSFQYYSPGGEDPWQIQNYTLCAGQTSYAITNCGISNSSIAGACSDAGTNPKTLYSECSTLSAGCSLHFNSNLTNPVTELYVFAQASWDMDGYGIIANYSSVQC
jgi:hypothetical protein